MSKKTLKNLMEDLVHQMDDDQKASYDLWTWLPSYKEAVKHHEDYALEQIPDVSDVMKEAAMFISHGLKPTKEQIKEAGEFYECPCGEHGPNSTLEC